MAQSQPHKSLDAMADQQANQQPNQPMYRAQPGRSANIGDIGIPGPDETGERGWKGAAAGGISGGCKLMSYPLRVMFDLGSTVGGHQVGGTGTTLISTCEQKQPVST